ncbi:MAG: hypothetical protein IPM33_03790 [Phycisphaerales bacterium]|nr:hypothetical protein [Phycisphaerales bacterium]
MHFISVDSHRTELKPVALGKEQHDLLLSKLHNIWPGLAMHVRDIKYTQKYRNRDLLHVTTEKLYAALSSDDGNLRKYELTYQYDECKRVVKGMMPSVTIRVQFKEKDGSESRRISVSGYGCHAGDYQKFIDLCIDAWNTAVVAPPGLTMAQYALSLLYNEKMFNADLGPDTTPLVNRRQYDAAVRNMAVLIEASLRQKCIDAGEVRANNQTGCTLAVTAFHPETGCLRPPWPVADDACKGMQLLLMGYFQYIRNAWAHNAVVVGEDACGVHELLHLSNAIYTLIKSSAPRRVT